MTERKQAEWNLAAWLVGGLPLAGLLVKALQMLLEARGYGAIMVGVFMLVGVLPVAVLCALFSLWALIRWRKNTPVALLALWGPALVVVQVPSPLSYAARHTFWTSEAVS